MALVDPAPYAGGSATYGSVTNSYNYSGALVSPFLAASDIVVGASAFNTSVAGSHTHGLQPFQQTVNSSTGGWTWFFNSSTLQTSGTHSLALDPRFDVVAKFTYTEPQAVPEPASMALLGTGFLGMIGHGVRRRRTAHTDPGSEFSV